MCSEAGIVLETGEPREVMHFCLLCGFGAKAVNPYLAFEAVQKLYKEGSCRKTPPWTSTVTTTSAP